MSKSKVCYISLTNLYLTPYLNKYTKMSNNSYDVIYWNRHCLEECVGADNHYGYNEVLNEGDSRLRKARGYLKFIRYARDIIKGNNYDKLVILQTSLGILLSDLLVSKYRGKYILDIRDYTFENNRLFYNLLKKVVKNSYNTVISSRGYEEFLPDYQYTLVHNDTYIPEDQIKRFESKKYQMSNRKISISFIGLIRFNEQNKKIINIFRNDDRFTLKFIGTGANNLKDYCEKNNIINVELIDRFPPEKTLDYYFETDIIYNLYGNKNPLLDYALSNKLYYAAKLKIPILVCPNTYMEEIANEYGIGYTFDSTNERECSNLFDYYNNINWDEFYKESNRFIKTVNIDNKKFEKIIGDFLN